MNATTTQALTGAATGSRSAARASAPVATGGRFFQRSLLGRTLALFKRELAWVAVFSFFANVLMLTPTLYMMQVYDRVLVSGSEVTLLVLSAVMVLFFLTMAFAEWLRSRLLVRAGARFDETLNSAVFRSSFEASLGRAVRL